MSSGNFVGRKALFLSLTGRKCEFNAREGNFLLLLRSLATFPAFVDAGRSIPFVRFVSPFSALNSCSAYRVAAYLTVRKLHTKNCGGILETFGLLS